MERSQALVNKESNCIWKKRFENGEFQWAMPASYRSLSAEQRMDSFLVNENELVLLKRGQSAVFFALKPCQAVIIEGKYKVLSTGQQKRRILCIHKHVSTSHQSIFQWIRFYFPNPKVDIEKINIYTTEMDQNDYKKDWFGNTWQEWSLGLSQRNELYYFVDQLMQACEISQEKMEEIVWENNVNYKNNIISQPAAGLIVMHMGKGIEYYCTLPVLDDYLTHFSFIRLEKIMGAWSVIRNLLPLLISDKYNSIDLILALSYEKIREDFGTKIDDCVQQFIEADQKEFDKLQKNSMLWNIGICFGAVMGLWVVSTITMQFLRK
jgi:hypothetical protein